jgi:hypothetical protein
MDAREVQLIDEVISLAQGFRGHCLRSTAPDIAYTNPGGKCPFIEKIAQAKKFIPAPVFVGVWSDWAFPVLEMTAP